MFFWKIAQYNIFLLAELSVPGEWPRTLLAGMLISDLHGFSVLISTTILPENNNLNCCHLPIAISSEFSELHLNLVTYTVTRFLRSHLVSPCVNVNPSTTRSVKQLRRASAFIWTDFWFRNQWYQLTRNIFLPNASLGLSHWARDFEEVQREKYEIGESDKQKIALDTSNYQLTGSDVTRHGLDSRLRIWKEDQICRNSPRTWKEIPHFDVIVSCT